MARTVQTADGRNVIVRPVARRIPALPDGTSDGYCVDYLDGHPRVTYNTDRVSTDRLGALVHELATVSAVAS